MKSELAIKRELAQMMQAWNLARQGHDIHSAGEAAGAVQALAWALGGNVMAPSHFYRVSKRKAKRKQVRAA